MPVSHAIAIQDVLVPASEIDADFAAAKSGRIDHFGFGLIAFSNEVTGDFDRNGAAVPFGATKLIRMWRDGHLPPHWRIWYDEGGFDQANWSHKLGDLALNASATVTTLGAIATATWSEPMFIKPTRDLKAFAGQLLAPGESIAERLATLTTDSSLTPGEPVLMAPNVEVEREYRCWVIGGLLCATSLYADHGRRSVAPTTLDEHNWLAGVHDAIRRRHAPAPCYVVDIASNGGGRVVEFNCFNCAGRYAADRRFLFDMAAKYADFAMDGRADEWYSARME